MSDDQSVVDLQSEIRELEAEAERTQREFDNQIRNVMKEIGRKRGQSVESVEELKCDKHPNAKFIKFHNIPGGYLAISKDLELEEKELGLYVCEECAKESQGMTMAYECPICGFVYGEPEERDYRSPQESWEQLAGREGEYYYCRVCGTKLGHYYWKIS